MMAHHYCHYFDSCGSVAFDDVARERVTRNVHETHVRLLVVSFASQTINRDDLVVV